MSRFIKNTLGFTITELMVAVALIGILSAIAIPSYNTHVARGHQAQAKIFLSAIHNVEDIFHTETGKYTNCLKQIGFNPSNEASRWYTVGFSDTTGNNTYDAYKFDINGNVVGKFYCPDITKGNCCTSADWRWISNSCGRPDWLASCKATLPGHPGAGASSFTATAAGNISKNQVIDTWTVDENKNLINTISGL